MVFSDRMEISNPGYLPHYLNVEQIRYSLPNRRNPLPASHAPHLLSYRGMRSSISRALKAWPGIELADDRPGHQSKAIIYDWSSVKNNAHESWTQ